MNNRFGISEKSWTLLLDVLAKNPIVERALLFGSRAKGDFKKGSDIDIAIYGDHVDNYIALELSSQLNEGIPSPYFFDVISGKTITNPDLMDHIERVGQLIYKRSNGTHT